MAQTPKTAFYRVFATELEFERDKAPDPCFDTAYFVMGGNPCENKDQQVIQAVRGISLMMPKLADFRVEVSEMTENQVSCYEENPAPIECEQIFPDNSFMAITHVRFLGQQGVEAYKPEDVTPKNIILTGRK